MKENQLKKGVCRLGKSIALGFMSFGQGFGSLIIGIGLITAFITTHQYHVKKWPLSPLLGFISGLLIVIPWLALYGLPKALKYFKLQNAFESIGLKNSLGIPPKVIDIHEKKTSQWLTLISNGIGIDKFKDKAQDLESALGLGIDTIESGHTPNIVRISLMGTPIPRICDYERLKEALTIPYGFLVGMGAREPVTQSILSLPHLIIAGTTGGGKSVFFKQSLLCLLQTSPRIQMYLFDLKGGVEMNVFSMLPNAQVYKNAIDAVTALEALNIEMDKRLKYLAEKEFSKVDFERDKFDMIIIGVDEASELYGKSSNKTEQEIIEKAREATDRLTKLARASGIHVILATQKVLKETIDTKIQENIGGRMVFRMNTLQGSMTVLGTKRALEIPDIPGRAIWSTGNKFTEVQAPYLSDDELKKSLIRIKGSFEEGERKNFHPMLTFMKEFEETKPNKDKMSVFISAND